MGVIQFGHARQTVILRWAGIPEAADDADSQKVFHPQGSDTMHIVGIEITDSSGVATGASGNTTARVSLSSLGAGIDATITEAARRSAAATVESPGLEFTGGDAIYVHRPAVAGGHADLEVAIHILMA